MRKDEVEETPMEGQRMYQSEMPKWARDCLKAAKREGWRIGMLQANDRMGGAVFYDPEQLITATEGVARAITRAMVAACKCDLKLVAMMIADEFDNAVDETDRFLDANENDREERRRREEEKAAERRVVDELNRQKAGKPKKTESRDPARVAHNSALIAELAERYCTYVEPRAVKYMSGWLADTVRGCFEYHRAEAVITLEMAVRYNPRGYDH